MTVDRPELTDGVVRLRAHRDDDIDAMVEMCRDPEMVRWTSVPRPYDREHARRFARELVPHGWETGEWRGWAIEATDDEGRARFAGNLDIRGQVVADIGFALHPWARGRGLMIRAIRLATRWAFDEGGVEIVHWRAHVGNVASRRTAWAAGFTFHGTVPKLLHEQGRAIDAWIGSLRPDASGKPTTRWLETPVLTGERVTLRPFRDDDVPRIVEACTDPRTRQWLPGLPDPYTETEARRYLLSRIENASIGESVTWCVADPDTDELLASINIFDLRDPHPHAGEIGYWAHPKARGRDVTSEAVGLVVRHGFTPVEDGGLGLRRLQIAAGADNAASRRVAVVNGFTEVGRHRGAAKLGDGTYTDMIWYDRLATD